MSIEVMLQDVNFNYDVTFKFMSLRFLRKAKHILQQLYKKYAYLIEQYI